MGSQPTIATDVNLKVGRARVNLPLNFYQDNHIVCDLRYKDAFFLFLSTVVSAIFDAIKIE